MTFFATKLRVLISLTQLLQILEIKSLYHAPFFGKNNFSILKDIWTSFVIPENLVIIPHVIWLYFDIVLDVPWENGVSAHGIADYNNYQSWNAPSPYLFDRGEIVSWVDLEVCIFGVTFCEFLVQLKEFEFVFVPYEKIASVHHKIIYLATWNFHYPLFMNRSPMELYLFNQNILDFSSQLVDFFEFEILISGLKNIKGILSLPDLLGVYFVVAHTVDLDACI